MAQCTGTRFQLSGSTGSHKLNLIKEQLEKYDMIDGYELDFMRFIVLFKSGEGKEKAPLITDHGA